MIAYPVNFPQPSISLTSETVASNLRSGQTNGLIEQVARFSTALETYNSTWEVSKEELLTFENWFNENLVGGVLVFGLVLPDDGAYSVKPVRFIGGAYQVSHKGNLWYSISAQFEHLRVTKTSAIRNPTIPNFLRLEVDPVKSQNLTKAYFNSSLTTRALSGSQTTLRIYPPTNPSQYILFGLRNSGNGDTLITSVNVDPFPTPPIVDWPLNLPNINTQVLQTSKRRVVRTEMESGHVRQFLDSDLTQNSFTVEWEFTLTQLKTFQDFFFVSLKAGEYAMSLKMPVDGGFVSTAVRFVGGKFSESYFGKSMFKVAATLERVVSQTVNASSETPYPIFYAPKVGISRNTKLLAADAGKLFVVNPTEGQTISLHISNLNIEFGLLVIGLGNVLVTRGGFIESLSGSDSAGGFYGKPAFSLASVIFDIGQIQNDLGSGIYNLPSFELISVVNNLGNLESDVAASSYSKPSFEIKTVQVDLGTLSSDFASSSYNKPIFELIIA